MPGSNGCRSSFTEDDADVPRRGWTRAGWMEIGYSRACRNFAFQNCYSNASLAEQRRFLRGGEQKMITPMD